MNRFKLIKKFKKHKNDLKQSRKNTTITYRQVWSFLYLVTVNENVPWGSNLKHGLLSRNRFNFKSKNKLTIYPSL